MPTNAVVVTDEGDGTFKVRQYDGTGAVTYTSPPNRSAGQALDDARNRKRTLSIATLTNSIAGHPFPTG